FSFNDFLGQRTQAKGFKVAGVYVGGKHDVDVGGGICQVSTTLYNAAVRGEIKVNSRSPHSLPVPYVPLGQDAAVSYPNPDLKITNEHDFPIALAATPEKSTLTFRILGASKPEFTYKFESQLISTWSRGQKIVHDSGLKYGVRKVMDRGGSGRKVRTWKLTFKDGKLVKRENMGDSIYSGGPVIIAVNKSAKPAAPKTLVKPDAPVPILPASSEG
ncbi:MAG: VanW family protein, partial [Fimbriimonadaceae bacterium]